MAGSIYGKLFQISTWGESHGKGIGVVIDGCPAGLPLSEEDIQIITNYLMINYGVIESNITLERSGFENEKI